MSPNDIPNTTPYFYLGMLVIAAIVGLYVVRLAVGFRSLKRDLETLSREQ